MAESLRLFFALWPDEATRARLAHATPLLGPGGRAIPIENLHVTLAFLGSTDAQRLAALDALARRVRGQPFVLTLDHYEVWDRALVALLPQTMPTELELLACELNARLAQAEFPTDSRPYRAHVTLIRERRRGSGRREGLLAPVASSTVATPIAWPVNSFALVQSQTGPQGSRYAVMGHWPLG